MNTAKWRIEYTGDSVSHMQFCPDDDNLLFFAGALNDRVWLLDRLSGSARRLYERDAKAKQWITHESWIPGRNELSLVDWPKGIIAINIHTGETRRVTQINAWHAVSNKRGTQMVMDTNHPDIGLLLLDPRLTSQTPTLLCQSKATNVGEHWKHPFPYDNGPIQVYAPQHTHPHPSFSSDGRHVVFTSDMSGFSQVYEVEI